MIGGNIAKQICSRSHSDYWMVHPYKLLHGRAAFRSGQNSMYFILKMIPIFQLVLIAPCSYSQEY